MCQYDRRCPVGTHRPGTVCPYARTSGPRIPDGNWPPPGPPGQPPRRGVREANDAASAPGPSRYGPATVAAGVTLTDVLVLLLIGASQRHHDTLGHQGVALVVALVLLPLAVAAHLAWKCTAWNRQDPGRCSRPRPGVFRRCHDHRAQLVTAHDVVAVLAAVLAIAAAGVVLA